MNSQLARYVVSASLLGTAALLPTASSATTYTYTPSAGDFVTSVSFTTSLSGAALDNLAPGTPITGTITSFIFDVAPHQDQLGFPIGGAFGSNYYNVPSGVSFLIGTNATGQITSWSISTNVAGGIFASYPAVPNEDPHDFFCTYSGSVTSGGNSLTLVQDNNAGLCGGSKTSAAGSFGAAVVTPTTPLPAALPLFATGLGALGLFGWRRKKKAEALAA